jgi:hypothetical protein
VPVLGCKSHVGIDRRHGLIRSLIVTRVAAHDGGAHRSAASLAALAKLGLTARLQRPKPRGKPMPRRGRARLRLPEAAPAPGGPHHPQRRGTPTQPERSHPGRLIASISHDAPALRGALLG